MISSLQKKLFFRDGFFVMDCQFNTQTLQEVRSEIDRLHEATRVQVAKKGDTKRIKEIDNRFFQWQVHTESTVIAELLKHSCYLDICRNFVGRNADLYTGLAAVKVAVHGAAFPWHQDSIYAITDPLESITTWTAIDYTTCNNGCLYVIPGSHRQGLRPHKFDEMSIATADISEDEKKQAIVLEMVPGQIAVFSSLLLHKTGSNITQANRRSILFQFHSPSVVLACTREPIGDRHPVIRKGRPANALPVKGNTGVDKYL